MCPHSLSDPDAFRNVNELEFVDVPGTLNELQTELKQAVDGVRSNDFWAAADLVFIYALNGDDRGAFDALQRFESCSPPPPASAYKASIHWIDCVAQLDTPRMEALNKVKALLENSLSKRNSG